jgi:hypothetical protein
MRRKRLKPHEIRIVTSRFSMFRDMSRTRKSLIATCLFATIFLAGMYAAPYVRSYDAPEYYTFENAPYSGIMYLIYRDGTNYVSRNLDTGVTSTDTNCTTLVHTLRDTMDNGTIYFKAGVYTLNLVIDRKDITIKGDGHNSTYFRNDNANPVIDIQGASGTSLKGITIEDVTIQGSGSSGVGIQATHCYHTLTIEGVRVQGMDSYGVYLEHCYDALLHDCIISSSTGWGVYAEQCHAMGITDCYIINNGGATAGNIHLNHTSGSSIHGTTVENSKYGVKVSDASNGVTMSNSFLEVNNEGSNLVWITGNSTYYPRNTVIENCLFEGKAGAWPDAYIYIDYATETKVEGNYLPVYPGMIGINITAQASYTKIEGNHFLSTGTFVTDLGTGTTIIQPQDQGFWWSGENRTDLIANPTSEATFIVETDGTYTWMTNCSTGQRDATGTNATQIINACYGNMTGGILSISEGDYSLSGRIMPSSNTTLYMNQGVTLKLADGSNKDVVYIDGVENVMVVGGHINANRAGQTWGGFNQQIFGIFIKNSSDVWIDGVHISNASTSSISVNVKDDTGWNTACSNVWIKNCVSENSAADGISSAYSHHVYYINNIINGFSDNGIAAVLGYELQWIGNIIHNGNLGISPFPHNDGCGISLQYEGSDAPHDVLISDNQVYDCTFGVSLGAYRTTVRNNMISNMTTYGIYSGASTLFNHTVIADNNIYNTGDVAIYNFNDNVEISGNFIDKTANTKNGISLGDCDNVDVSNNILSNIGANAIAGWDCNNCTVEFNKIREATTGIMFTSYNGGTNNCTVIGNFIRGTATALSLDATCCYTWIEGNDFRFNTNAVNPLGTNSIIRDNIGYVTENYVTATNTTATTFVFNHGLAGTADYVFCSFNTTAIDGYAWTADATNITVTVTGAGLPAIMTCYAEVIHEP